MTRLALSSSLFLLLFSPLSMSCATRSGAQSRADGPLLAPVSSALVAKVTRCQTAADCGAPAIDSVAYVCRQNLCALISAARLPGPAAGEAEPAAEAQTAAATEITPDEPEAKPADTTDKPADATATPADSPSPADAPTADPPTQPGDTTAVDRPLKDEAEPYPTPRS
jgi:hypothetical protein